MGRRLSVLGRRMRAQGTPRLWAVVILSLALHLVLGVHLLRTHPFIPFKPICFEDGSVVNLSLRAPLYTLDGEMAEEFYYVLRYQLYYWGVPFRIADGGTILVTFADWYEENYLWNMTSKAIRKIIEEQEGTTFLGVPKEYYWEHKSPYKTSHCPLVRRIAIEPGFQ